MKPVTDAQIKEHLQNVLKVLAEVEIPTAISTLSAAIVVLLLSGVKQKADAIKVLDDIIARGKLDLEANWERRWVLNNAGSKQ